MIYHSCVASTIGQLSSSGRLDLFFLKLSSGGTSLIHGLCFVGEQHRAIPSLQSSELETSAFVLFFLLFFFEKKNKS